MTSTEVLMSRRNTKAFISAKPIAVTILRDVRTITEAGGSVVSSTQALPPQTFRQVPLEGYVWDRQKNNSNLGRIEDVQFNLICPHDADIQTFDRYEYQGKMWQVIHVHSEPAQLRERILATVRLQDEGRT